MKLIFATNNQHKVEEIQSVIGHLHEIISLQKAGINKEIPEPHETLEANASEKSRTIHLLTQENCFSEDTGLEVASLNGAPGVKSARYAGEHSTFEANIDKLLQQLSNDKQRKARFRTVISLILNQVEHQFEGICDGEILTHRRGDKGFGYDAIFQPTGSNKSFAEMSMEEKNIYSHRKKATDKLILFLKGISIS